MNMLYGGPRLLADLTALGHEAELVTASNWQPFVVIPSYAIELGRFAGRRIGLGLMATPDFPRTVAASIQVRSQPHLFDLKDSVPNVRNIQPSPLGTNGATGAGTSAGPRNGRPGGCCRK